STTRSLAMQVSASSALRTVALVARKDDPDALPASEASDRARAIAQLAKPPERSAIGVVAGGGVSAHIVGRPAPALDPEEIKLLVKQGEQFAAAGDLVGARAVLQRAAQA